MSSPESSAYDLFKLSGQRLEGRFRVDRAIAEGGFGVVYEGWHLGLDARVAIKVLKTPEGLAEATRVAFIEKFLSEAKTMARIRHPHIVQVLDTGASVMPSGVHAPWMVLEWLHGVDLQTVLLQRGAQPPAQVLALLRPAIEAIAFAHDEGIAHRDIKPENMMLVETRRGPSIRVLDFGIAKLMDANEQAGSGATNTQSQLNAFSPLYGSPEQIGRTRTGPWTDVHALGLVLTQALTGRPPLPTYDLTETFREVLSPVRPTPAKFGVDVGPWEAVIAKAVAYRPDGRFQSAGELLAALQAALPDGALPGSGGFPSVSGAFPTPAAPSSIPASTPSGHATTLASVTATPARPAGTTRASTAAVVGLLGALGLAGGVGLAVRFVGPAREAPAEARVSAVGRPRESTPAPSVTPSVTPSAAPSPAASAAPVVTPRETRPPETVRPVVAAVVAPRVAPAARVRATAASGPAAPSAPAQPPSRPEPEPHAPVGANGASNF